MLTHIDTSYLYDSPSKPYYLHTYVPIEITPYPFDTVVNIFASLAFCTIFTGGPLQTSKFQERNYQLLLFVPSLTVGRKLRVRNKRNTKQ